MFIGEDRWCGHDGQRKELSFTCRSILGGKVVFFSFTMTESERSSAGFVFQVAIFVGASVPRRAILSFFFCPYGVSTAAVAAAAVLMVARPTVIKPIYYPSPVPTIGFPDESEQVVNCQPRRHHGRGYFYSTVIPLISSGSRSRFSEWPWP